MLPKQDDDQEDKSLLSNFWKYDGKEKEVEQNG